MAICLDLFLAADRYDAAGGQDPRAVEWPPHPARVFSAFRSVATDEDLPALRELERLSPPIVHASDAVEEGRSRAYVVTNTLASTGGNLNHPGRTSGLRERRSIFPHHSRVQLIWQASDELADEIVARLDSLARRVPYLGRSTSVALMGVRRVDAATVPDGLRAYQPVDDDSGTLRLRVPYPGYTDELNALYGQGLSAWQATDGARAKRWYRLMDGLASALPLGEYQSPYRDLVVLRFVDARPAGRMTPVFTAALRSMVMGQTSQPLPPALHGHGFDGHPHVAYLGLPVCGSPHADGHLVGLAVAIPGMEEQERRRILRGILKSEDPEASLVKLDVPGFRKPLMLKYQPDKPVPRAATDWHWKRKSRQWVTATPIVLDRYPKDGDVASGVLRSITNTGFPEPALVEVSTAALSTGAVDLKPTELPRRARGRLFCHARVKFDQPVWGPVLAGAGRYFGVGLFLPENVGGVEHDAR